MDAGRRRFDDRRLSFLAVRNSGPIPNCQLPIFLKWAVVKLMSKRWQNSICCVWTSSGCGCISLLDSLRFGRPLVLLLSSAASIERCHQLSTGFCLTVQLDVKGNLVFLIPFERSSKFGPIFEATDAIATTTFECYRSSEREKPLAAPNQNPLGPN